MGEHGDAAGDQVLHRLGHDRAAFELDGIGTMRHQRGGAAKRLCGRLLIAAKRHVGDHAGVPRCAHHRRRVLSRLLQRERQRIGMPVGHHRRRIANQDEVEILVDDPGRREIVGRERNDLALALQCAQLRHRHALDFSMDTHDTPRRLVRYFLRGNLRDFPGCLFSR